MTDLLEVWSMEVLVVVVLQEELLAKDL